MGNTKKLGVYFKKEECGQKMENEGRKSYCRAPRLNFSATPLNYLCDNKKCIEIFQASVELYGEGSHPVISQVC